MKKRKTASGERKDFFALAPQNRVVRILVEKEILSIPLGVYAFLVFGLLLRLLFFDGMGTSDDLAYSKFAAEFPSGEPQESTLYTRMGLILPTALSYHLFGINDLSSILFVLLCALGMIPLAYSFGKLLFSKEAGMLASFLMAIFPMDIVYSTRLLSDLPSAFFMSLGVYAFLYAEIRREGNSPFLFVLSGFLIGVGYFIRESALLIGLFFLCYGGWKLWNREISLKNWQYLLVGLGLIFALILEGIFFYHLTGEAYFRERASQAHLERAHLGLDNFGRTDFPIGLLHYPYLFLTSELLNVFYALVAIALFYFLFGKARGGDFRKHPHILMIWLIPLILWLSFGTSSFHGYFPFKAADRYLSIVTIPAIVLLSAFLLEKERLIQRVLLPSAILLLLLASVGGPYLYGNRGILDPLDDLIPSLESVGKRVYTDERSARAILYLTDFEKRIDARPYPEEMSGVRDSYVLINRKVVEDLKKTRDTYVFSEEIENPPLSWKKISSSKDGSAILYYIE